MNDTHPLQGIHIYPDGRMSNADAVKYIGITKSTLNNWRTMGKGPPFVKLGKHVFYFKDDLDRWLTAHRVSSTGEFFAKQAMGGS